MLLYQSARFGDENGPWCVESSDGEKTYTISGFDMTKNQAENLAQCMNEAALAAVREARKESV